MCTVYCELYTVYYGLYTVHCTVYTVHCILYTVWLILDSHVTLMRGYNDVSADNQDFCFILISVNYSFDNLDMHVLLPKHIIETNEYCFSLLENGYTLDQQHSFSSSSHCLESNCQMYSGFADRRNSPTITAAVQSVQFRNTAKIQEIQKYSQDTGNTEIQPRHLLSSAVQFVFPYHVECNAVCCAIQSTLFRNTPPAVLLAFQ